MDLLALDVNKGCHDEQELGYNYYRYSVVGI